MSANTVPFKLHDAPVVIPDPGASGTINVDRSPCVVNLSTAAAESRTLARPTVAGARVLLHFASDGGDCTVTPTGGFNESGSTTIVFANVGEFAEFVSFMTSAGVYFWRQTTNSNIGNNPLVVQGAALTAAKPAFTIADAEGTPDEAIQAVTSTSPFGFVNAAELITLLYKVQNMHVRVGEIEARLEAAGIIAAN